jgi:hypothetical protein
MGGLFFLSRKAGQMPVLWRYLVAIGPAYSNCIDVSNNLALRATVTGGNFIVNRG